MEDWKIGQLNKVAQTGERVFRYDDGQEYVILSVDDNLCHMLGYERSDLLVSCRNRVREMVYSPDLENVAEDINHSLRTKGEYQAKYRMRQKSGETIWVMDVGRIETGIEGEKQVRSLIININQIELMRRQCDSLYNSTPGGVIRVLITDNNFYITDANLKFYEIFHTTKEEYIGSSGIYTVPEDLAKLRSHLIHCAKSRKPVELMFRCLLPGAKELLWFQMLGNFFNEQEEGCEYLCILVDVSKREKRFLELKRDRDRYHMVMRNLADYIFEYNLENERLTISGNYEGAEHILCIDEGVYPDVREALTKDDLIYPEDYGKCVYMAQSRGKARIQIRIRCRNRSDDTISYQWYELESHTIEQKGTVVAITGTVIHTGDKEERNKKQLELRNIAEMQYNKTFELVVYIRVENGFMQGYLMDGDVFEKYYPENNFDAFVERTALSYVHPDDRERFIQSFQLSHMTDILIHSKEEEMQYFRLRTPKEEDYRYKCIRYSFLGEHTDAIIFNGQDVHIFYEEQLREDDATKRILANALSEERTTNEMRRNFNAMISRELSDPLKMIEKTLRDPVDDQKRQTMHRASEYMINVVNNIMEYERIEQGKIRFESKRFRLDDILWESFRSCRDMARSCGVEFTVELELKWKSFFGDVGRISQVFNHILGNCIVASSEMDEDTEWSINRKKVQVWASDDDQGGGISVLHMIVEDTGIPVADSFFGREYPIRSKGVKSMFEKGNGARDTAFSLILARKIIDMMGGQIELYRKKKEINVIEIMLPLKRSEDAEKTVLTDVRTHTSEVDLSGYSLLLLEGSKSKEYMNGPLLKLNGATVYMVNSAKETMDLWRDYSGERFDAILVSDDLEDMDYLEFTEWFRSQNSEKAKKIPIFLLAGKTKSDAIQMGLETGINSVLFRPINLKQLRSILDMVTGQIWKKN